MRPPRRTVVALLALVLPAGLVRAATIELNDAPLAEIERLRGIGPALAERIVAERAKARFTGWSDLIRRTPGIRAATAAKLSESGLRIDGRPYAPPEPMAPSAPPN